MKKNVRELTEKASVATMLLMVSMQANAQDFKVPGLSELACSIIKWMTGELAVIIFFVVGISTLLVGMMMKMDWAKIVSVIVMFGLIQGFMGLFGSYITGAFACTA